MRLLLILAMALAAISCTMRPMELNSLTDLARINGKLPRTKATVFVHVPASIQTLSGKLSVDGQTMAKLPNRSFTKVTLLPGNHTIDIKFPVITGPNCERFTFNFQKDTVYHLVLTDGPQVQSLGALIVDGMLYRTVYLRPVHAFDGIERSRYENYVASMEH
jgi:hypothetical protein